MKTWTSGKKGTLTAAATALTSSFVTMGGVICVSGYDQLVVLTRWTKGDETSLEIKVQFSDTLLFTNAYERTVTSTDAAGLSTLLNNSFTSTTTGNSELPIAVRMPYARVQYKATGGSPSGTIGADYLLTNIQR